MLIKLIQILFLFIFLSVRTTAQSDSSYYVAMNSLWQQHQKKSITDSAYLKYTDSVASMGYGYAGYYTSLQNYRRIAFALKGANPYRESYYRHLTYDAMIMQQTGRSIYYVKQLTEEAKKTHANLLPEIGMSSFLIGTYTEYNAYDKVVLEYRKVLPQLEQLPSLIKKDRVNVKSVEHGIKSIAFAMVAPPLVKDSSVLRHATQLADAIYRASLQNKNPEFSYNLPNLEYFYYLIQFLYYKNFPPSRPVLAFKELDKARDVLLSSKFRELNGDVAEKLLSEYYILAAAEYTEVKNADSAAHYLKLYQQLNLDTAIVAKKKVYEILARINAIQQNYKMAYLHLDTAFEAEYEHVGKVISDQNDNLYAQAEAEDQKELLDETTEQKRTSEDRLRFFAGSSLALVAIAILLPLYLRQRQKAKFLNFKLNMARNLHDETNPALLYAKALAKSNRAKDTDGNSVKSELERHLDFTMESIRSLSHDLKSENQHTIADLTKELTQSLKKLGSVHPFSFRINDKMVARNFLSHQQFTYLKAILFECITNSIKHATFDKISIIFREENRKLHIDYSDNGSGWPDTHKTGIGLDNMSERSSQLNGELSIHNNYPEGYVITITVPVRPYENAAI